MTPQEERRIDRLQTIKRTLEAAKNPDIEKLIANCQMEWGITRRTAMEYIKVVQYSLE